MTEPYLGEIQILGFNFPPYQWAFASGQILPISQNTGLFSLIGALYGGDGRVTFMLPNLASRQACGTGQGPGLTERQAGDTFGDANVMLLDSEIPQHNHVMNIYTGASAPTVKPQPDGTLGTFYSVGEPLFLAAPGAATTMHPMMVQPAGGSLPHDNAQPYLGLNFSIALAGDFPSFG